MSPLKIGWLLLLVAAELRAAEALHERYLALDPALFVKTAGVSLVVNPPIRREVVIRADRPWENLMISFYTTVREDGGKLRLWYLTRARNGQGHVGYAESSDGVQWTKPDLGLVEYDGTKANNLTDLASGDGTPFIDPKGGAEARFVCLANVRFPGGIGRSTSADGWHWKQDAKVLLPFPSDTQNVTFWDPRLEQYVVFLRGWSPKYRNVKRVALPTLTQPSGLVNSGKGRTSGSKDSPRYLLDELPTILECDQDDPSRTDIYTMAAQPYPLDPSWYVAFPAFLRRSLVSDAENYAGAHRGQVETQFAGSNDTIHWHRYNRAAYAGASIAAPEKRNMVFMGTGLIVRGDEIWQYATEFESEHADTAARLKKTDGVIVRYVQRVDGFVSLDSGNALGVIRTVPVKVTAATLTLNLDTGALGELRVAVLDRAGREVSGFEADNCGPLQGNGSGVTVQWKDHPDLSAQLGEEVVLEFRSTRTKLYSFRFK